MKPLLVFLLRVLDRNALRRLTTLSALAVLAVSAVPGFAQAAFQYPSPLTVASQTNDQAINVPISGTGTIGDVRVLTGGIPFADFVSVSANSCAKGSIFSTPGNCSMVVRFQPQAPGERRGAVLVLDANGAIMGARALYGIGVGPVTVMIPATINTVAGDGNWVYKPGDDGVAATNSPLYLPSGVAVDPAGNIYIADTNNNRIRYVDAKTGVITTVAGNGDPGNANDGGPATLAELSNPAGIVLDGAGDLYIADTGNQAIRKLTLATQTLSTVAGMLAVQGSSGDNGPATLARLNAPEGLALDAAGDLYISDTGNNVIRKVDAATQTITTYAGTIGGAGGFSGDKGPASSAKLNMPWGLATDANGNLYIADFGNSRIRVVSPLGNITTIAGTGVSDPSTTGSPATSTNLKSPAAVFVDVAGNIYVADTGHNLVLKINALTKIVSIAAGDGNQSISGDLGPATKASLYGPYALTLDSNGDLYIADIFHHRIREVFNNQSTLNYDPIRVGRTSPSKNQTVENDGNADLQWSGLIPDRSSAIDNTNTTCAVGTPMATDATCVLAAEFAPQITGKPVTATIQLTSNAANSPGVITLSGESDALEPTKTIVVSSQNPSALGSNVTFTATVTSAANPAGTMQFYDGTTLLGSATTNASGAATYTTSALTLGSHTISAAFTGDASNSPSTSPDITQVVKQGPTVGLNSSVNPTEVGGSTTFTATVSASKVQPTGDVAFMDGKTKLGTVSLNASGVAMLPIASLTAGTHNIVAAYQGDTATLAASSAPLTQTVNKWTTATTLGSSLTPSTVGSPVTFTITVSPTSSVVPSGTVVLTDGTSALVNLQLDASGKAIYTTSALTVGSHSLQAQFLGDATNDTSTSTPFSQVVQKISTSTTLMSSANPANGGTTVHLSAQVTPASTNSVAGSLTGTVLFTEGATTLGSGTLSSNGTATLDISTLTVASHTIIATYSGNAGYASSASLPLTQVVQLASTSVQLNSSQTPAVAGNNIVFTAVVSGNGGVPSGTVTFLDNGVQIGQGKLNAAGQVTITTSTLPPGTDSIIASYLGDAASSPSQSAPFAEVVQQATSTVTLVSSNNPAIGGTSITFGATISNNGKLPSGQLLLMEGQTVIATATISATGTAQFTVSTLTAGTHMLVATFAGNSTNAPASSTALAQTVQLADTILSLASSANPSMVNSNVTFTVKLGSNGIQPTGTVTFSDGGSTIGTAFIASGVASFSTSALTLGAHSITASYAGDTTHNAATPATLTQTVQQTTTTAISSSLNPALVGNTVVLTAGVVAANNKNVTGSVSFYDAGTLLGTASIANNGATLSVSTLTAGSHLLTAKYSGDATNQASASSSLTEVVNTAGTTVLLTSSGSPSVQGAAVLFTATVTSTGEAPAGKVTFSDGLAVLGTVPVSNGTAVLSVTALSAGQHAIVASYGGDNGTETSTSTVLIQIVQAQTSVGLMPDANPILTAQRVTFTATITGSNPTGSVTFMDGSTLLGQSVVNAGTATLLVPSLSAGSHSINASYSGDAYNLPSASKLFTETVNMRPSSTSVTASSQTYATGDQVTVVAVVHTDGPVGPTGTVSFTVNGQTIGTGIVDGSGAATFTFDPSATQYNIIAVYSGDPVYSASTSDSYDISKGPGANFNLSTDPSSITMASGDHITMNVVASSNGNFTDTLSIACLNLPVYATCTLSANQMKLAAGGSASTQIVFDTGLPLGAGPRAQARSSGGSGARGAMLAIPAALLLGIMSLFGKRSRRQLRLGALLSVLLLLGASMGLAGCGSINVSKTPPGTYNIRVLATGASTGITETVNVVVTVQ